MDNKHNANNTPSNVLDLVTERLMRLNRIRSRGGKIKETTMLHAFIKAAERGLVARGVVVKPA
jgi:hypothetical protein